MGWIQDQIEHHTKVVEVFKFAYTPETKEAIDKAIEYNNQRRMEEGKEILKYQYNELKEFIKRGKEYGDVGMIPLYKDSNGIVMYKGFGTIEHPMKEMLSIFMKHDELFDGKWDPLGIIKSSKTPHEYEFIMIDLSKDK